MKGPTCTLCGAAHWSHEPHDLKGVQARPMARAILSGKKEQKVTTALVRISETEARALTERIKVAADELWRLLKQAHDGQAWAALGYASWKAYVETEFEMSERHSYRLVDHATFVEELGSGLTDRSALTEWQTRPIRSHDAKRELVERVKVAMSQGVSRSQAIKDVLADHQLPKDLPGLQVLDKAEVHTFMSVYSALEALADSGHTPQEVIDMVPQFFRHKITAKLTTAKQWLEEFTQRWPNE